MFPVASSNNSDPGGHRWFHNNPCRHPINRQCFCGFLFVCSLVIFTPLLFTDRIRFIKSDAKEFKLSILSDISGPPVGGNNSGLIRPPKKDPRYVIQPSVCSTSGRMPFMVLFIPSRPQHADERAALRESWGFHARLCHVRIVFGMGLIPTTELQHELFVENSVYGDILQTAEVVDAYHNQTRLILSFLHWGLDHCGGVKFIGKADEDSWINIFGVLRYLSLPQSATAITGHFLWTEKVKRLVEEKWYLTKEEYANDTYPPFAVGQLYVFPFKYLPYVLETSKKITVHWLDDVYIGGQIPDMMKMNRLHIQERADLSEVDGMQCVGRDYMIVHAVSAERKREFFYDKCMTFYRKNTCRSSLITQQIAFREEETPRENPVLFVETIAATSPSVNLTG